MKSRGKLILKTIMITYSGPVQMVRVFQKYLRQILGKPRMNHKYEISVLFDYIAAN